MNEFGETMEWSVEIILAFVGVMVMCEGGCLLFRLWHCIHRPTGRDGRDISSGHTIG